MLNVSTVNPFQKSIIFPFSGLSFFPTSILWLTLCLFLPCRTSFLCVHFVPFPITKSLFLQLGTNDGIQNSLHRCRPTQLSANKVGISGSSPDRAPKRQQAITWSKKAYTYTSLHLSFARLCQTIQPINVDETRKRSTNSNNNHKRSQTNQLIFTLPIKDNREDLVSKGPRKRSKFTISVPGSRPRFDYVHQCAR